MVVGGQSDTVLTVQRPIFVGWVEPLVAGAIAIIVIFTVAAPSVHFAVSAGALAIHRPSSGLSEDVGEPPVDADPTSEDEIPGLGSIIGSPEAGPKPDDAGDRGGYAQLALAAVLFGGVGFILRKIFRTTARTAQPQESET